MCVLSETIATGMQAARELKAQGDCANNLRQMALALRNHYNLTKRFPSRLTEVLRVANFPATGEKDGYKISPDIRQPEKQGGWILNATPEPSVTGSQSCVPNLLQNSLGS
jgi:hypothetical protein